MSDSNADMIRKFQAFLEQDGKVDSTNEAQAAARSSQIAFWVEMRRALMVNEASTGIEAVDGLAAAIIDDKPRSPHALLKPVILLPAPAQQKPCAGVPAHPMFDSPAAAPKPAPTPTAKAKASAETKKRASSSSTKGRTKKVKTKAGTTPATLLDFTLPSDVPKEVLEAIESIYLKATLTQQKPYQVAYPWVDENLWYDPEAFPEVYLAHWRFWNSSRAAFFEWALHAPLATDSARTQRRKRKMAAFRERLAFLSVSIETFGYYGLLERLEGEGNDRLMWWGGQAGKSSSDAKKYVCSPIRGLLDLYNGDPAAFQKKVEDASKPFQMDADGFKTMTELLETTAALDPDLAELDKRLSDRALARVVVDVTSSKKVPKHWKPPQTKGIWRKLVGDSHLRDLANEVAAQLKHGEYEFPTVPPFEPKEAKRAGYEPLRRPNGKPTALGPITTVEESDQGSKSGPKKTTHKSNGSDDSESSDCDSDEQEKSGDEA